MMKLWLHWLMFGLTMFAASGVDISGGGGDGGASGAISEPGSSGEITGGGEGTGEGEPSGGEEGEGSGESVQEVVEGSSEPQFVADETGRQIPSKYADLFKQDKDLKSLWFASQALKTAIPGGFKAAIEEHKALEAVGGVEGIQTLQQDVDSFQHFDQLFSENPEQWVKETFGADPEQATKATRLALQHIKATNPEMGEHIEAGMVWDKLSGDDSPLVAIYNLLAANKDVPEAVALAKQLAGWYNKFEKLSKTVPEKKIDPQQKALTEREQAAEKRESAISMNEVSSIAFPAFKSGVMGLLAKEAKALGVDVAKFAEAQPGAYRSMLSDIQQKVTIACSADQRFVNNFQARLRAKDTRGAAELQKKKEAMVYPDIARKVGAEYGLLKKTPATNARRTTQGNGNGNASAGIMRVSGPPDRSQIDWAKTTGGPNGNIMLDDQAILRDGKHVTWAK